MTAAVLTVGDVTTELRHMADESVQCAVTSPPYWGLRDYGVEGQLGLEKTPSEYVAKMVAVFRDVRRVLRPDGTLWLNIGDSYANDSKWGGATGGKHAGGLHGEPVGRAKRCTGLKGKDLVGIPWMLAFALRAHGWYLRSEIIWHKPNPMPESVTDRPTKAHETVFLLTKSPKYFYDAAAIAEPVVRGDAGSTYTEGKTAINGKGRTQSAQSRALAKGAVARSGGVLSGGVEASTLGVAAAETRNKRSVWTIPPQPFRGAHFATFPERLVEPCVLAGSAPDDVVLDPFAGSCTTAVVALRHGRSFVGIELSPAYAEIARQRVEKSGVGELLVC